MEDAQLLRTERHDCCKKIPEPPPEENEHKCCKKEISVIVHDEGNILEEDSHIENVEEEMRQEAREQSPPITCCHNAKTSSESQEQIVT